MLPHFWLPANPYFPMKSRLLMANHLESPTDRPATQKAGLPKAGRDGGGVPAFFHRGRTANHVCVKELPQIQEPDVEPGGGTAPQVPWLVPDTPTDYSKKVGGWAEASPQHKSRGRKFLCRQHQEYSCMKSHHHQLPGGGHLEQSGNIR